MRGQLAIGAVFLQPGAFGDGAADQAVNAGQLIARQGRLSQPPDQVPFLVARAEQHHIGLKTGQGKFDQVRAGVGPAGFGQPGWAIYATKAERSLAAARVRSSSAPMKGGVRA